MVFGLFGSKEGAGGTWSSFLKKWGFVALCVLAVYLYVVIPWRQVGDVAVLVGYGFLTLAGLFAAYALFLWLGGRMNYKKQLNSILKMGGGKKSSGLHGTADFARKNDLKNMDLLRPDGFILGRYEGQFLRFKKMGHLITFAPTRSGKGVGHVIPNLLDHPGSVVVNDIKGENYAISHRYRSQFTDVYTFAPFAETSNSLNPLDFVRVSTEYEMDDVQLIVGMMIEMNDKSDPFWDRAAQEMITGLIFHVLHNSPPELRNLSEVRYLLMMDEKDFTNVLDSMAKSKHELVQRYGNAIKKHTEKVMSSVLAVAKAQTLIWDSPRLKSVTMSSDFNPMWLKERPCSLYIVIPPEYLDTYKPIMRLMTGIVIASLARTPKRPQHPVLYLIDEFPALGYMPNIESAIGWLAGYGVSLWLFIQDLSQIKANYQKWDSLVANCSVRAAFGTNDVETAKVLSDMMGTTTVTSRGTGTSKNSMFQVFNDSHSVNISEQSRPLMTPDEVMRIPFDTQAIFVQGGKPIIAEKIMYFSDPYFKGKYDKWEG
ncbi:MAG: type IV secretory system conjugative DNA transfer family protein [Alphaproteobacteria bacterium]